MNQKDQMALCLAYGGQTALNCGVKLDETDVLKKYGIHVLGTQIPGIQKNRRIDSFQRFNARMWCTSSKEQDSNKF